MMTQNLGFESTHLPSIEFAQLKIERLLEEQSQQVILESVEVDSLGSGVYRVWRDSRLLGTFQRHIDNDLWTSQARNYPPLPRCRKY